MYPAMNISASAPSVSARSASCTARDQRTRQTQQFAQALLFARHAAIIPLMVVSTKMQQSMQRKQLGLFTQAMAMAPGLCSRDRQGDGDISGAARSRSRERKHVSDSILVSELAVQPANIGVRGQQNADFTTEADQPLHAAGKSCGAPC